MKLRLTLFFVLSVLLLKAQDTIVIDNNYTFKLGVKFTTEGSADVTRYANIFYNVFGGGIQLIGKVKESKSSIESGIYYTTKAKNYEACCFQEYYYPYEFSVPIIVFYRYLSVPINYRYDTKVIYASGGVFFDYLLNHSTRSEYLIDSVSNYGIDRKFSIGYNFSIGVEKQISHAFNFFVEGRIFNTVSSAKMDGNFLLNDGDLKTSYRNYGIAIGANYKLFHAKK